MDYMAIHTLLELGWERASASGDHEIKEKWIRVSPKKRGNLSSTPQSARANYDGIRMFEPDPLMKHSQPSAQIIHPPSIDKGKAVLDEEVHSQEHKLHTEKYFNCNAMKNVFKNAWKAAKDIIIRDLDRNLFAFQFFFVVDKDYSVNFQVDIDITRPLRRGIRVMVQGKAIWISFKYVKLLDFCYYCGCLGHVLRGCELSSDATDDIDLQYEDWLRGSPTKSQEWLNAAVKQEENNVASKSKVKLSFDASHAAPTDASTPTKEGPVSYLDNMILDGDPFYNLEMELSSRSLLKEAKPHLVTGNIGYLRSYVNEFMAAMHSHYLFSQSQVPLALVMGPA
ncbi:hypothetical protein Cgig2_003638 [Carnegiea gigantea]|uniref:CCHC-type domain-containing protein n=1 Tax=Carnegiea gigantea TaxID=171969 RepID=A0A9Q1GU97_9CARY|nr:hypothetical protein Cgig2_003638 [Carnegiea gigantea]